MTDTSSPAPSPVDAFVAAVYARDVDRVRSLLESEPDVAPRINDPLFHFDSPAVFEACGNLPLLDVLLEHGADLNRKTSWKLGGFGILETIDPDLAGPLIDRGAEVDIHAASNLGRLDRVRELLDADPELVHSKGGDGKRPLHSARTVDIARLLLERGADLEARCDDHGSTAAHYLIGSVPEVAAFLVDRGAVTDVMLLSALGDVARLRQLLDAEPDAVHSRITPERFPGPEQAAGHIYEWTIGRGFSPHRAAHGFGQDDALALLLERSDARERLLAGLWIGRRDLVDDALESDPGLVATFEEGDLRDLADAARDNETTVVSAMLEVGFPITSRGQHGATPLHWSAFHGNADMTARILEHDPPLELVDGDGHGTPLGWALHGAGHGWNLAGHDYPRTVSRLLEAGCNHEAFRGSGVAEVDAVLERFREEDS